MDWAVVSKASDNILRKSHSKSPTILIKLLLHLNGITDGFFDKVEDTLRNFKDFLVWNWMNSSIEDQKYCLSHRIVLADELDQVQNFCAHLLIKVRMFKSNDDHLKEPAETID